jgi:hypothetical protein
MKDSDGREGLGLYLNSRREHTVALLNIALLARVVGRKSKEVSLIFGSFSPQKKNRNGSIISAATV